MEILDIHTHHLPTPPFSAIWNCMPKDFPLSFPVGYYSVGIHPWYIVCEDLEKQKETLMAAVLTDRRVVGLGEAGLDKTCSVPWKLQLDAFKWQVQLGDTTGLPLVLHVVKAHHEVIELKKKFHPRNQWIVHGFRGKKELARQYLREGFSLSYGNAYNEDALCSTPFDRLFFETDCAPQTIRDIYDQAAQTLGLSSEKLTHQVQQNIKRVFFMNKSCNFE